VTAPTPDQDDPNEPMETADGGMGDIDEEEAG
jgi:hypothetical protein